MLQSLAVICPEHCLPSETLAANSVLRQSSIFCSSHVKTFGLKTLPSMISWMRGSLSTNGLPHVTHDSCPLRLGWDMSDMSTTLWRNWWSCSTMYTPEIKMEPNNWYSSLYIYFTCFTYIARSLSQVPF